MRGSSEPSRRLAKSEKQHCYREGLPIVRTDIHQYPWNIPNTIQSRKYSHLIPIWLKLKHPPHQVNNYQDGTRMATSVSITTCPYQRTRTKSKATTFGQWFLRGSQCLPLNLIIQLPNHTPQFPSPKFCSGGHLNFQKLLCENNLRKGPKLSISGNAVCDKPIWK